MGEPVRRGRPSWKLAALARRHPTRYAAPPPRRVCPAGCIGRLGGVLPMLPGAALPDRTTPLLKPAPPAAPPRRARRSSCLGRCAARLLERAASCGEAKVPRFLQAALTAEQLADLRARLEARMLGYQQSTRRAHQRLKRHRQAGHTQPAGPVGEDSCEPATPTQPPSSAAAEPASEGAVCQRGAMIGDSCELVDGASNGKPLGGQDEAEQPELVSSVAHLGQQEIDQGDQLARSVSFSLEQLDPAQPELTQPSSNIQQGSQALEGSTAKPKAIAHKRKRAPQRRNRSKKAECHTSSNHRRVKPHRPRKPTWVKYTESNDKDVKRAGRLMRMVHIVDRSFTQCSLPQVWSDMNQNFEEYCVEMEETLRALMARDKQAMQSRLANQPQAKQAGASWFVDELEGTSSWLSDLIQEQAVILSGNVSAQNSVTVLAHEAATLDELLAAPPKDFIVAIYPPGIEVVDIATDLLNQHLADSFLSVFGGVTIQKHWLTANEEGKCGWLPPLCRAVKSATAASSYSGVLKRRRPRVNSRWRDAFVQLTVAINRLSSAPNGPIEFPPARKCFPNENAPIIEPKVHPYEEGDLKATVLSHLRLCRLRILRQVGLFQEALLGIHVLVSECQPAPEGELAEDDNIWQACLLWNRIVTHLARGDASAAVVELNILIRKRLGHLRDALVLRATLRTRANDWQGAIPDFSHAINTSPKGSADRAMLHLRRAKCIAEDLYHCLIEHPGSPDHAEEVGDLICAEGLYVDGLNLIKAALSIVSETVQAIGVICIAPLLVLRGRFHAQAAEYAQAFADYSQAIEHAPNFHYAHLHRARLLRMCSPRTALSDINCFLQYRGKHNSDEKISLGFYLRGLISLRLRGPDNQTITDLVTSALYAPGATSAMKRNALAAGLLAQVGAADAGLRLCNQTIRKRDPSVCPSLELHYARALCYIALRQYELALHDANYVTMLCPASMLAPPIRAVCLFALKRPELSLKQLGYYFENMKRTSSDMVPEERVRVLVNLAKVKLLQENFAGAAVEVQQAIQHKNSPEHLCLLNSIYLHAIVHAESSNEKQVLIKHARVAAEDAASLELKCAMEADVELCNYSVETWMCRARTLMMIYIHKGGSEATYENEELSMAVHALNRAIAIRREDPALHCELGKLKMLAGIEDRGFRDFTAALTLSSTTFPEAMLLLAGIYEHREDDVKAKQLFTRIIEHGDEPFCTYALINRGALKLKQGCVATAIDDLSRAIDGGSADWLAFYNRGLAYFMLDQLDEAMADFERALPGCKMPALVLKQMGLICLCQNKHAASLEHISSAIKHHVAPESDVLLLYGHCLALRAAGRLDGALDAVQSAIKRHPREASLRLCHGVLCFEKAKNTGNSSELLKVGKSAFQAALRIRPTLSSAAINLAFVCQLEGKLELGSSCLTALLRGDASNAIALEGRAIIHLLCGKTSDALLDISTALKCRSTNTGQINAMLHTSRALIYESLNEFASMQSEAMTAVRLDPESYHAQFSLGRLRMHRRQWRSAVSEFTRCLALKENDADAFLNRGICLFMNAKLQKAVDDFSCAINCRPNDLPAHFNRAVVCEKLGRLQQARADCEQVLKLMPDGRCLLLRMKVHRASASTALALEDFRRALELDEELATSAIYNLTDG